MAATRMRVDPSSLGDMALFSTGDAEARGISRRDLGVMVRRELVWRVARGWYSNRMDATADERHVLRAAATVRMQGAGSIAHRHTAALLHGLPLARTDLSVVEIAKARSTHGRTAKGVRISELDVEQFECVSIDVPGVDTAVPAVSPAWAIVGTAMTNNPVAALVAGDHALRHRVCSRAQIEAALLVARGSMGVSRAREALVHLEPRHESPGETLTAAVLRRSPWSFEPQVQVRAAGRNYRLDFGLRDRKLAIEFDGVIKYTSPEVMAAQVERENNLRAEGWDFVRFGWVDFDDEAEMHRRVAVKAHECRIVA